MIDLFTRRSVGRAFSSKPDKELVIKALDMADEQRGRPQPSQLRKLQCIDLKLKFIDALKEAARRKQDI